MLNEITVARYVPPRSDVYPLALLRYSLCTSYSVQVLVMCVAISRYTIHGINDVCR